MATEWRAGGPARGSDKVAHVVQRKAGCALGGEDPQACSNRRRGSISSRLPGGSDSYVGEEV